MKGQATGQWPEPMPRGVAITMTIGVFALIASVVLLLAVFTWQPWQTEQPGPGGIQGGGNPTPVPERQATPYSP